MCNKLTDQLFENVELGEPDLDYDNSGCQVRLFTTVRSPTDELHDSARSQPQVWFAQDEAQFNLWKNTTVETQYYYVLSALDQGTTTRLLDLINNPQYQALKDRLLETFCLSLSGNMPLSYFTFSLWATANPPL